jgi:hypothetical protein
MNSAARPAQLDPPVAETTAICEQAITTYLNDRDRPPSLAFSQKTTLALALLAEYSRRERLDEDDLRLLGEACADAAATCHSQPPEDTLVTAAAAFTATANACRRRLGQAPSTPPNATWRRFLYNQTAIEVARSAAGWHVRHGTQQADNKLLDLALDELLTASNAQIAALTIQILDWHLHLDKRPAD